MNENQSWSLGVGRWMGVRVSVNMLLLLFIAAIFCVEYQYQHLLGRDVGNTAIVTTLVLLASVVLHEFSHVFAMVNLGGMPRRLVLMPWGGNSEFHLPAEPVARLIVHAAGPFCNAAVFLVSAVLLVQANEASVGDLINPFRPHTFAVAGGMVALLKLVAWVNFQLLWVNLIPCFPFDGAQLCRTALEMMGLADSKVRSESAMMVLGNGFGLTLMGLAWLTYGHKFGVVGPVWFLMLAAGITLYFAARYSFECETWAIHEETHCPNNDWDLAGYENERPFFPVVENTDREGHSLDLAAYDQPEESQWEQERTTVHAVSESQCAIEEEQQADAILQKLHAGGGVGSLTDDERNLLNRVSHRLRQRRDQAQMQRE